MITTANTAAIIPARRIRTLWLCCQALLLMVLTIPCLSGCAALGLAAQALPKPTIPAKYAELHGQTVAIMVWVERGSRTDWPEMRLDIANGIQQQLQQAVKDKIREVEGARFPVSPTTIAQLQDDHPEWLADGIEDVALRLGVSRVIYVEIEGFQTRSDASVELFRGSITGRAKLVEVNNGKARVALSEDSIREVYPRKGLEEGEPNKNDYDIYRGTIKAFTTTVTNLFIPHQQDDD